MSILIPDSREDKILAAALAVFGRYGFKRASMADIASEAGLSRPLLYLSFANKTEIFTAVARSLSDELADAGEAAWPSGTDIAVGLPALVAAHHVPLFRLLKGSAHGTELLAADSGVVEELHRSSLIRLEQFVASRLGPTSASTARMIVSALHGFKELASSEADLLDYANRLAGLVSAAQAKAAEAIAPAA